MFNFPKARATSRRQFNFHPISSQKFLVYTHFTDLRRMKGWVHLGATQWFWTQNSWTGNPALWPLGHCPNPDFLQKSGSVRHKYIQAPNAKFQKKLMSQFWENLQTDGRTDWWKDGWTIFYKTLPAEAGGPIKYGLVIVLLIGCVFNQYKILLGKYFWNISSRFSHLCLFLLSFTITIFLMKINKK